MAEGFQGLDRVTRRIGQLATDVRHVERPLKAIGVYLVGSVQRAMYAGGKPKPFTPLAKSTIAARRKGKGRGGAKPLINNAQLVKSISSNVVSSGGDAGVEVGTNYGPIPGGSIAALMHFGGKKSYTIVPKNKKFLSFMGADGSKVLARKVNHPPPPPRPFMVLQMPEDRDKSVAIVEKYLARK
jgi:phage gpG-like protein